MSRISKYKQEIRHYYRVVSNRISSLRPFLLVLLLLAILSIVFLGILTIKLPCINPFYSGFINFSLRLSYAYISAFVFYFLVVHLPAENKKVAAYRQLNNKIIVLDEELSQIIYLILDNVNYEYKTQKGHFSISDISMKEFKQYCSYTNSQKPPNLEFYNHSFPSWYEFLNYKSTKIKRLIDDLLILNNIIDVEVLRLLLYVEDEVGKLYSDVRYANTTLEVHSHTLYKASFNSEYLIKTFFKRYRKYSREDSYFYIKQYQSMKSRK